MTEKEQIFYRLKLAQGLLNDEPGGRSPWELFGETDARQALATAEQAARLAEEITGAQS